MSNPNLKFTGPAVDVVPDGATLPASSAVVVIGGGIIGVCAALTIATRGIPVTVCEKGIVAGEQSSRNSGWCRQAGRDIREMPLILQSLRQWRGMNETINAETGFRQCGTLYLGSTLGDERGFLAWVDQVRDFDTGAKVVYGRELAALLPGAQQTFTSGLYVKSDGRAEPQQAAPAIARAAQLQGALVLQNCAVRGLERSAGRVSAVITEHGRIVCDTVIVAGGAWSSLICAGLDLSFPQLKVLIPVMRTAPVANGPEVNTWLSNLGYRKRLDGGYTVNAASGYSVPLVPDAWRFLRDFLPLLRREWKSFKPMLDRQSLQAFCTQRRPFLDRPGAFEAARILNPTPSRALNAQALQAMAALFPAFKEVSILQEWAGYVDVTPDVTPCISAIDTIPGLTLASGFSGHGFGLGPGAGRLCAEVALGETPCVDPTAFRWSRFHDGSPLVLGAEI